MRQVRQSLACTILIIFFLFFTKKVLAKEEASATCLDCLENQSLFKLNNIEVDKIQVSGFDACVSSSNSAAVQKAWDQYKKDLTQKILINKSSMADTIKIPAKALTLIENLFAIKPYLLALEKITANKEIKNLLSNNRYREIMKSSEMTKQFILGGFDQILMDNGLNKVLKDPQYIEANQQLKAELSKQEVRSAIKSIRNLYGNESAMSTYMKKQLDVLDGAQRISALSLISFFESKKISLNDIQNLKTNPPLMKDFPLPPLISVAGLKSLAKTGTAAGTGLGATGAGEVFNSAYRDLLKEAQEEYLKNNKVTIFAAQKINPTFNQKDVDRINNLLPPTEQNAFDEHIYELYKNKGPKEVTSEGKKVQITPEQSAAIAGLVRTLWGESRSCEAMGLPQFTAIGKIIADRSITIDSALTERKSIVQKQNENMISDLEKLISRQSISNYSLTKRGLADFGRVEKINMNSVSQVFSKERQFSVWNSFNISTLSISLKIQNIPDIKIEIQGPQAMNDDQALNAILCPQNKNKDGSTMELWKKAEQVATQIVLDPKKYSSSTAWKPSNEEILFYTHGLPLSFAKEVKIDQIRTPSGAFQNLRGTSPSPCNEFRLFQPQQKGQY